MVKEYTRREAAEYLGVTLRTIDRWRAAGWLPERRRGGPRQRPRFTQHALDKLKVEPK